MYVCDVCQHCILSNNHDLYHGDTASLGRALPFGGSSIGVSEDWMKSALELLFSLSRDPVLIVGSALSCVDAALIACVRRIQRWSLTSVLAEFRQVTGRKIFDLEQFIEFFDVSIVQIPSHRMPSYLDIFLKVEVSELYAYYCLVLFLLRYYDMLYFRILKFGAMERSYMRMKSCLT